MKCLQAFSFLCALTIATNAPALAGPYMSWGQWTSNTGVPFGQCWNGAPQGLRSVGLSSDQDGRFFHGSNDAFTASVICYDLGNRFVVTITVAQSLGTENNGMTTDQVRDRILAVIFGTQTASCASASPVGRWRWWDGTGTVTLNADGTAVHGSGAPGNWGRLSSGGYAIHWPTWNSTDYFTISPDGMSMPGNYDGHTATSTRVC